MNPFLASKICFVSALCAAALIPSGCATPRSTAAAQTDPLVQRFARLATASISDAVDQVTGQRGFMSHQIKPVYPARICGRALTVLARPSQRSEPPALALQTIDAAPAGSVLVIVMEGPHGADVAAFGGIMGTGCHARGLAGAVLDGGCRDIAELEAMGFPVFARGIVPSSSVGRYVNVAKGEAVVCGGVTVRPGDILAGDRDGVVVVPAERAGEILRRAEELEAKEAATTRDVRRLKSIQKAVQRQNRI